MVAAAWVPIGPAVGQNLLPEAIAGGSAWGLAAGWQPEIGFFEIAMAVVAFRAFRSSDLEFQRSDYPPSPGRHQSPDGFYFRTAPLGPRRIRTIEPGFPFSGVLPIW